jgi:hypothetical protein
LKYGTFGWATSNLLNQSKEVGHRRDYEQKTRNNSSRKGAMRNPSRRSQKLCTGYNFRESYAQCSSACRWRRRHFRSPRLQFLRIWATCRFTAFHRSPSRATS